MSGLIVNPFRASGACCIPVCASCKVPVEKFQMNTDSPHTLVITASCHGKTSTVGIDVKDALAKKWVLMFARPTGFNGTRMAPTP